MAEKSYFWTTGTSGDGTSTFTQAELSEAVRILCACHGWEGVGAGYLNSLECTDGGANTVAVNTGGAVVDGKPYSNTASVNVNVPSAVGGGNTRIDRIVLRATWASYTVRITRIAGTDAASPTAPAITQTPGTTYDIQLCQVLVDTSGAVTVTDERDWAQLAVANNLAAGILAASALGRALMATGFFDAATVLDKFGAGSFTTANLTALIPDNAITNAILLDLILNGAFQADAPTRALFADGIWTAAQIADRTRTFMVGLAGDGDGKFVDGSTINGYGTFFIPSDFASTLTVTPVVIGPATANLRWSASYNYGADGQAYTTHSASVAATTTALTNTQIKALTETSLASAAAGDYVRLAFTREGADALDTLSATMVFLGWKISYTADS